MFPSIAISWRARVSVTATLLTLVVLPVLYVAWFGRQRPAEQDSAAPELATSDQPF